MIIFSLIFRLEYDLSRVFYRWLRMLSNDR